LRPQFVVTPDLIRGRPGPPPIFVNKNPPFGGFLFKKIECRGGVCKAHEDGQNLYIFWSFYDTIVNMFTSKEFKNALKMETKKY
jgi:hypothetical protein